MELKRHQLINLTGFNNFYYYLGNDSQTGRQKGVNQLCQLHGGEWYRVYLVVDKDGSGLDATLINPEGERVWIDCNPFFFHFFIQPKTH